MEAECVETLKALRRAGVIGMFHLDRVWPSIKKHYGVSDDDVVLKQAGIYRKRKSHTDAV